MCSLGWAESFSGVSISFHWLEGDSWWSALPLATPLSWDKSHPWVPLVSLLSHEGCYECFSCENKPQMAMQFAKQARWILLICICVDARNPDHACYQHFSQWHQVFAAKATVCLGGNNTMSQTWQMFSSLRKTNRINSRRWKKKAKMTQNAEKKVGICKRENPKRGLWWVTRSSGEGK